MDSVRKKGMKFCASRFTRFSYGRCFPDAWRDVERKDASIGLEKTYERTESITPCKRAAGERS